jgi:hypothetical protein
VGNKRETRWDRPDVTLIAMAIHALASVSSFQKEIEGAYVENNISKEEEGEETKSE